MIAGMFTAIATPMKPLLRTIEVTPASARSVPNSANPVAESRAPTAPR